MSPPIDSVFILIANVWCVDEKVHSIIFIQGVAHLHAIREFTVLNQDNFFNKHVDVII